MRAGRVMGWTGVTAFWGVLAAGPAGAQFAVIDVAAIVQDIQEVESLAQQVETAKQQLSTAQDQLTQARAELQALSGGRGMEALLAGTNRNYLPRNWAEVSAVLSGSAGAYGALSGEVSANVQANAVLTNATLASYSSAEQALLTNDRQRAATAQALSREALSSASDRFASLQQLIAAIGTATDPKAILDLQARIQAEEAMVTNEQLKVHLLDQTLSAEEAAQRQRVRELAIQDLGSLRALPPLGLTAAP